MKARGTIWEACRVTLLRRLHFLGKPPVAHVDGGLGYNKPIRSLWEEVVHVWLERKIGCIIPHFYGRYRVS